MFNRQWYNESIFKHFDIKAILTFCILVIFIEIFRVLLFISKGEIDGERFSFVLIIIGALFIISFVYRRNLEEKIAFLLFGLAFLMGGGVKQYVPNLYIPLSYVWIVFEIVGTFGFLIAYKKYKQKS